MSYHSFTTVTLLDEDADSLSAELSDDEIRHMRALRIHAQETIVLRDHQGNGVELEVTQLEGNHVQGTVAKHLPKKELRDFTLVCGVSRSERMDHTLRSATELGVANIVPVLTQRCVVRLGDEGKLYAKMRHWKGVIQSAVKQSGRSLPPEIAEPRDIMDIVGEVSAYDLFIVAWEETEEGHIGTAIQSRAEELGKPASQLSVALLIGPEGGLAKEEVDAFVQRGAAVVSMGTTILRCETACIVGSALALSAMGEL